MDAHADIEQNQEMNSNMFIFTSFFDHPMTVFVFEARRMFWCVIRSSQIVIVWHIFVFAC